MKLITFAKPLKPFIKKVPSCSQDEYYKQISESKFAICPRGCGIQSYRFWDCIALGCVPIVEHYNSYDEMNDLPILVIKSIKD